MRGRETESGLERKVAQRTLLFEDLGRKGENSKQLVQSESLAAIGQLVAGAAHELNNLSAAPPAYTEQPGNNSQRRRAAR